MSDGKYSRLGADKEYRMPSIPNSELRRGMVIRGEDGQLYMVVEKELRTPGNLRSRLKMKLKNIMTGGVNEHRLHPDDKTEQVILETHEMQYLYKAGNEFVFMNTETYEQLTLNPDMVGDLPLYVQEGANVRIAFIDGKALSVDLPAAVDLEIAETEPGIKGATAQAQYKPATATTGLKIQVPSFVNKGDKISVDTRSGEYLGRVKA